MAQSRIISIDDNFISFWYQRHEDNKKVTETITIFEFIQRLIIHIPDEQFKMIRYYDIILPCEVSGMEDVNDLRRKYMENPPEGYTAKDIERMSDEDILDMDYFLNE